MWRTTNILAAASLACPVAWAAAPSIGIYADSTGTRCDIHQTVPGPGAFYILATLGGAASEGIRAAELGIAGVPDDWFTSAIPNPVAQTYLWNPLQGGGVVLFTGCQPGDGVHVLLYTIVYYAFGIPAPGHTLAITRNVHRFDPNFQCPLVKVCDDVPEIRLCVPGLPARINDPACTVGVSPATWSGVRGLYQR